MVNLRADGNCYCSSSQSEDGTLVHRHAQPEGQAGTLNFFQQRICVTWKQRKQLMERPTHGDQWRCRMVHTEVQRQVPFTESLQTVHLGVVRRYPQDSHGLPKSPTARGIVQFVHVRTRPSDKISQYQTIYHGYLPKLCSWRAVSSPGMLIDFRSSARL